LQVPPKQKCIIGCERQSHPFYVTGSMAVCAMKDSSTTEAIVSLRILNVVAG
jgi:hypothetical protein